MTFLRIELAIVAALVTIVFAVGFSLYNNHHRQTIEIKKDEWECVKSEKRTHLQLMLVGNVKIMQPIISTVCTEYRRHAG